MESGEKGKVKSSVKRRSRDRVVKMLDVTSGAKRGLFGSIKRKAKDGSATTGNSNSRFLKPGALAQLRDARISKVAGTSSLCTAIGRKRVLVSTAEVAQTVANDNLKAAATSSPQKKIPLPSDSSSSPSTPKVCKLSLNAALFLDEEAPQASSSSPGGSSKTPIDSVPFDILVKILCFLHHDQLKNAFHVSQRFREASVAARDYYFNYTTPDRSRQEMLKVTTPRPEEHWPFESSMASPGMRRCPITPMAPKHGPRPPSRLSQGEMRLISASLFQTTSSGRNRRRRPPGLPRPKANRPVASHRVLFYEDELCKAVAQNTLR